VLKSSYRLKCDNEPVGGIFLHHIVEQLQSEGYAIIRGFLSHAEIASVSAEADRIYAAVYR
jgi:hypothetical protein